MEQTRKFKLPDFKFYDIPETHPLAGYFPPGFKCPIQLPDTLRKRQHECLNCYEYFPPHLENVMNASSPRLLEKQHECIPGCKDDLTKKPPYYDGMFESRRKRPIKKRKVRSFLYIIVMAYEHVSMKIFRLCPYLLANWFNVVNLTHTR